MHNGQIGGFTEIRRDLEQLISDDLYSYRAGTTDSEAFFLLALSNGLAEDIPAALSTAVRLTLEVMDAHQIEQPFHMTAAISDGRTLYALRYSNDRLSPSLYYATGGTVRIENHEVDFTPGEEAVLVLSEPLDEQTEEWRAIPESHLFCARGAEISVAPFSA